MFHVGKLVLTSVITTLGTTAIAANSISYQIIEFPNIMGLSIGLALVVIIGQDIVSAFSLSKEASDSAVLVLRCFSIASLPIWPLSFTLPNALRGAGDVRYSMIGSIISMWFGRVIVSYVLIVYFHLGILGVWIGMFVDWYGRGITYLLRFKSRKWLYKKAV